MMVLTYDMENEKKQFLYNIEVPVEDTIKAELFSIKPRRIFPQFHKYKILSKEEDSIFTNRKYYNGIITFQYSNNTYQFQNDSVLLSIPESDFKNHVIVNNLSIIEKGKDNYLSNLILYLVFNILILIFVLYFSIIFIKHLFTTVRSLKNQ